MGNYRLWHLKQITPTTTQLGRHCSTPARVITRPSGTQWIEVLTKCFSTMSPSGVVLTGRVWLISCSPNCIMKAATFLFRLWNVEGGMPGQMCQVGTESACTTLAPIPDCRNITCNEFHTEGMKWTQLSDTSSPYPSNLFVAGTNASVFCDQPNAYFNYPDGGNNFTSYSRTINVKTVNLSCDLNGWV